MSVIGSLLRMHARVSTLPDVKTALADAVDRISILSDIHDFLSASGPDRVIDLSSYLEELLSKLERLHRRATISLKLDPSRIELAERHALPVILIINELITNSMKHAFPSDRIGRVAVEIQRDGARLEVVVHDDGRGCPPDPRPGVGTRLMDAMAHQLDATLAREPVDHGCRTRLVVPDISARRAQTLFHP